MFYVILLFPRRLIFFCFFCTISFVDNYEITVTAASGIEGVVKKELKSLGFADPKAFDGSITVRGSSVDVARLNMFLRCADRVYITIGKFNASSFDELFDGVSALPLADIFPFNARIVVNGKCRKSRLFVRRAPCSLP